MKRKEANRERRAQLDEASAGLKKGPASAEDKGKRSGLRHRAASAEGGGERRPLGRDT